MFEVSHTPNHAQAYERAHQARSEAVAAFMRLLFRRTRPSAARPDGVVTA